jgi:UDP-glucose 4-epimerase
MKILITGGAGFIGSHLATLLLERGHRVTALDSLETGRRQNIAHLSSHGKFELIEADGQRPGVAEIMVGRADAVVHLAAAVGVQRIIDNPVATLEVNVGFTQAVLQAASLKQARTLIASTSEVYGRGVSELFGETDDLLIGAPTSRRWGYAASKLLDEFLALAHWHEYKLPVTVMRLFNTVGPRQTGRYGMVVPRFISQALTDAPITVFGDGEQRRTFTDVAQSVRAIADLLECDASHGEVVNIGGTAEVSMNQLASTIIEMTGSKSTIKRIDYLEAYGEHFEDMRRRNPDTAKLKRLLGWAPEATIQEILAPVIADIRARIARGESMG